MEFTEVMIQNTQLAEVWNANRGQHNFLQKLGFIHVTNVWENIGIQKEHRVCFAEQHGLFVVVSSAGLVFISPFFENQHKREKMEKQLTKFDLQKVEDLPITIPESILFFLRRQKFPLG